MPLHIIKSDLVSMATDAIVYDETPQPFSLFHFNPLMIHKTGKEILNTREALKPIIIGQAKIAPASLLDCKYIIHTSAPAWHGGGYHELGQLRTCYERVFELATEYGCKSIAMSIIATDKLGYPKALSQKTAMECIGEFLFTHNDVEVTLVLPGKTGIMLPGNQFTDVNMYLNKYHVKSENEAGDASSQETDLSEKNPEVFSLKLESHIKAANISHEELCWKANLTPEQLADLIEKKNTVPSKNRVIALAVALGLSLPETKDLLASAGYFLTKESRFDVIVEYCISQNICSIFDVNQILFRFEQELLG